MNRPIGIINMPKGNIAYQVHSLFDNKRELEFGLVKYKGNINLNEEN